MTPGVVEVTPSIQVGTGVDARFGVGAVVVDVIGVVVGSRVEAGHAVHVVQSPQPRHI